MGRPKSSLHKLYLPILIQYPPGFNTFQIVSMYLMMLCAVSIKNTVAIQSHESRKQGSRWAYGTAVNEVVIHVN